MSHVSKNLLCFCFPFYLQNYHFIACFPNGAIVTFVPEWVMISHNSSSLYQNLKIVSDQCMFAISIWNYNIILSQAISAKVCRLAINFNNLSIFSFICTLPNDKKKTFIFLISQEIHDDGMLINSAIVPHCLVSTPKVLKFEIFGLQFCNFFYWKWSGVGED